MKRTLVLGLLAIVVVSFTTLAVIKGVKKMDKDKAILVVSFGTSVEKTRKETIEACEKRIAAEFKDYRIERAFTSNIIRKIYKDKGVHINSVDEALARLKKDGVKTVVVQPLHVIPGEEYHEKILDPIDAAHNKKWFTKIVVGAPLLHSIEDYDKVVAVLQEEVAKLKTTDAYVFMGHGTHHFANSSYSCLQLKMQDKKLPYYIGTVEGYPELDHLEARLQRDSRKSVTLIPLMVVAGDHAMNDMAGDEDDSWKSILKSRGYTVSADMSGMGAYRGIQDLYIEHIHDALKGQSH